MIPEKNVLPPTLTLSYGGKLEQMEQLPGYAELMKVCKTHKIEVFKSMMSITSVVNVGEGSLAFAFAAEEHKLDL